MSVPRLELCGAFLLAQLIAKVENSLSSRISRTFLWCDSTIALSWIKSEASRWQTFVANRVSQIQELTPKAEWRHVDGTDNPADMISRGTEAKYLLNSRLWWYGPAWLLNPPSNWPQKEIKHNTTTPETKKMKLTFIVNNANFDIFSKYSSLHHKLKGVAAYCFRFYNNLKSKREDRDYSNLTTSEINTIHKK